MIDPLAHQARKQVWDAASVDASKATDSFNETQLRVLEARIGFFEKLALFDTGTIAATITMAGSLQAHEILHWKYVLFLGWILLLLAMGLCLLRNWSAQSHLFYASQARYNKKQAETVAAQASFLAVNVGPLVDELGVEVDAEQYVRDRESTAQEFRDTAENVEHKSEKMYRSMRYAENTALLATLVGISLLLAFTIRNFQ
jgi:hypothetical protein